MTTRIRPRWGDLVALVEPDGGPKEGLVVDVSDGTASRITVEDCRGKLVGGGPRIPASKVCVIREARFASGA